MRKRLNKFSIFYEKDQREVIENDIEKIKNMSAIEYLDILNNKAKEKLIGLCLDKSILDIIDDNSTTNDEDSEEFEESEDDE